MNTETNNDVNNGIKYVIVDREKIHKRVEELGKKISEDFAGRELVLIGVLKGSFIFFADLIRNISMPVTIDFISVSSYGAGTSTSGAVRLKKDIEVDVAGKDVIIVEDIIDTGLTLQYIKSLFKSRNSRTVSLCAALDKPSRRSEDVNMKVEYTGFEIPDEFVVGYGLDYAEKYRNLPDVCVLDSSVLT